MGRDVDDAIEALKGSTASLQEARTQLRKREGIYAWWMVGTPLSCAPATRHPSERGLGLVYVGIAPSGLGGKSTLRSRVLGNHLNGNIAASTLRLSLASLLIADLSLVPVKKRTKVVLSPEHNALLSEWQQKHLRLTWHETANPWDIEAEVVAALQPPLNLDDNKEHPFYETLSAARRALRSAAR